MGVTGHAWLADAVSGAPSYTGAMNRQATSAFMGGATSARPFGGVSGVRPGTSTSTVTATSTTWTAQPFAGTTDLEASASAGLYNFAFPSVTSGSITAANVSNARQDSLAVRINDGSQGDGTAVAPFVDIVYTAGTVNVSGTLVPASVPARSFVIANINVPISGGGSPTVTWVAPYTVAAGGIRPVTTSVGLTGNYVGETVDDLTLGYQVRWTGSAWRSLAGGMVPIYPTSVAGTGVSLSGGAVLFSAATSVSVSGVFTSLFDNYKVHFNTYTSSTSHGGGITLQASGTPNTAAQYSTKRRYAQDSSAAVSDIVASGTSFAAVPIAAAEHTAQWDFTAPAIASRVTRLHIQLDSWITPTSAVSYDASGRHNVTAAFDGFVYSPSTGNITGELRIYGWNNNA